MSLTLLDLMERLEEIAEVCDPATTPVKAINLDGLPVSHIVTRCAFPPEDDEQAPDVVWLGYVQDRDDPYGTPFLPTRNPEEDR